MSTDTETRPTLTAEQAYAGLRSLLVAQDVARYFEACPDPAVRWHATAVRLSCRALARSVCLTAEEGGE